MIGRARDGQSRGPARHGPQRALAVAPRRARAALGRRRLTRIAGRTGGGCKKMQNYINKRSGARGNASVAAVRSQHGCARPPARGARIWDGAVVGVGSWPARTRCTFRFYLFYNHEPHPFRVPGSLAACPADSAPASAPWRHEASHARRHSQTYAWSDSTHMTRHDNRQDTRGANSLAPRSRNLGRSLSSLSHPSPHILSCARGFSSRRTGARPHPLGAARAAGRARSPRSTSVRGEIIAETRVTHAVALSRPTW